MGWFVATVFGLVALGYAAHLHWRAAMARSWPTTEATVTRVYLKEEGEAGEGATRQPLFIPIVEYRYEVGGRSYSGQSIKVGAVTAVPYDNAMKALRFYREGRVYLLHFDPASPKRAVLEPRCDNFTVFTSAFVGAAILLGVAFFGLK